MSAGPKDPPPAEVDRVTYLPLDRTGVAEPIFSRTDPREVRAVGGVRIGKAAVFVPDAKMPRLTAEAVATASDALVRGRDTFRSLMTLGRAQVGDVDALLAASRDSEIKVRWERLWVLSPFLARLARSEEGRKALMAGMADDIAGIHLLSKFAEQNNHAVRRLFARLHDDLLPFLLARLVEYRQDPRRAMLLVSVIATVEAKEDVLKKAMPPALEPAIYEEVFNLLYVRYARGEGGQRLSSAVLRERLEGWRR